MTQTSKKVTQVKTLPELKRRIRVAAYARVSTDKDAMLHSLAGQIFYYKKLISQKPEWEFAGVYADKGISGTKENRLEFQKMIKEAKAGNIDLILTKAVSRFARNTLDTLSNIRKLKYKIKYLEAKRDKEVSKVKKEDAQAFLDSILN